MLPLSVRAYCRHDFRLSLLLITAADAALAVNNRFLITAIGDKNARKSSQSNGWPLEMDSVTGIRSDYYLPNHPWSRSRYKEYTH